MQEYLNLGHMHPIDSHIVSDYHSYYIPHYCVLPDSLTTKLRVVFDASTKDRISQPFGDTFLISLKLQNDLVAILVYFRLPSIIFTADIKQMYRQIMIDPSHRPYKRPL